MANLREELDRLDGQQDPQGIWIANQGVVGAFADLEQVLAQSFPTDHQQAREDDALERLQADIEVEGMRWMEEVLYPRLKQFLREQPIGIS
jgi:hypothetical protein